MKITIYIEHTRKDIPMPLIWALEAGGAIANKRIAGEGKTTESYTLPPITPRQLLAWPELLRYYLTHPTTEDPDITGYHITLTEFTTTQQQTQ
jgi:hypothetical protein